jgi:hypothetical protein
LLYSFEIAVLAAAILVVFLYGIRSFPGSPAVLLASVASQFKIAQVQAQTGYRQQFKMHFSDVCESLRPRTMLIFIDDLDRCEPGKTAEMLEAINYLVNSGPCFVVVGMARDIVEAQLAIHFNRVADVHKGAEAGQNKPGAPAQQAPADDAQDAARTRIDYVRNYLRKLVNLEVHIPEITRDKVFSLLELPPESVPDAPPEPVPGIWREKADALESVLRKQSRVVVAFGILIFAVLIVMLVQPGISQWDQTRLDKIRNGRKAADERLSSIREAERRAAVALDFARGKEKNIASELFNKYRVAVAGLEFRLPMDPPKAEKRDRIERCAFAESASRPQPSPSVKLEDSDELYCWRQSAGASRAVEEQLSQIKGSLASALAARSHDSFDRVARELTKAQKAAEAAEQLSGVMRTLPASAATIAPGASSPGTRTSPSEDAAGTPRKTEHDVFAYWMLYILLAWAALRALTRRDPYLLKDQPYFLDALRIWSPLLGTQSMFSVPREVKRFQNRARFYAMRLRKPAARLGWLSRIADRLDGSKDEKPDAKTFIPEEVIVALTAIYQVCPGLLTSRGSPIFDDNPLTRHVDVELVLEVKKYIAQHNERAAGTRSHDKPFAMFPKHRREVVAFLAIIEEFEPEPEPTLKAVA